MSAEIITIVSGQTLYKKGDNPRSCFILQKGSVHLLNEKGEKVAGVGPNMIFGEIEIFANLNYRSTAAICVTSGSAVSVPAEILDNKLKNISKYEALLIKEFAKNSINRIST